MILVDTSVWVDHFRRGNARLKLLLEDGEVATHPMVPGELACGSLARRRETLQLLESLPAIPQAPDRIVREAIETLRLWAGASAGSTPTSWLLPWSPAFRFGLWAGASHESW